MTASKTPNLGLMNPVASDPFVIEDFSNTFGILDQNPGVLTVPNQASRPTNFTAAQHGRIVLQADQQILWMWNQVNSGVTGGWSRVGNKGLIGEFQNGGTVATTTINRDLGPTVVQGSVLIPGGRPFLALFNYGIATSVGSRIIVSYWEDNVRLLSQVFNGVDPSARPAPGTTPLATAYYWMRPAPTVARTINFKVSIAAFGDVHPWGGGYTAVTDGKLHIIEL